MQSPEIEVESSSKSSTVRTGSLIVCGAVIWQGLGTAVMGHTIRPELSVVTTAVAFLIAAIVGMLGWRLQAKDAGHTNGLGSLVKKVGGHRLLLLNGVTAGAFGLFYIAATLIPPTGASVLEVGIGPVAVLLASRLISKSKVSSWASPVVVLLLSAVTAWGALVSTSTGAFQMATGAILCIIAGTCAAGVLLVSKSLSHDGITAWEISALRFHLVWVLGLCLAAPLINAAQPSPGDLLKVLIVAAFCITGPILLLQWGITMAKTIHSALLLACLPAAVLAGDLVLGSRFPILVVAGVSAIVAVSVWATIKK